MLEAPFVGALGHDQLRPAQLVQEIEDVRLSCELLKEVGAKAPADNRSLLEHGPCTWSEAVHPGHDGAFHRVRDLDLNLRQHCGSIPHGERSELEQRLQELLDEE